MLPLLTPILATLLLVQASAGRTVSGDVIDDRGKPVADAQVVFFAPPGAFDTRGPVEVRTKSDAEGKFSLKVPPLGRTVVGEANFLAYRRGMAIAASPFHIRPIRLVLQEPRPRTVKIEGPGGEPVSEARITLRMFYVFGRRRAEVAASLADPLATSTGADGTATIAYLGPRDQLVAVRIAADSIGTQEFLLTQRPGQSSEPSVIIVRLRNTSRLAGRIVSQDGQARRQQARRGLGEGWRRWVAAQPRRIQERPPAHRP